MRAEVGLAALLLFFFYAAGLLQWWIDSPSKRERERRRKYAQEQREQLEKRGLLRPAKRRRMGEDSVSGAGIADVLDDMDGGE